MARKVQDVELTLTARLIDHGDGRPFEIEEISGVVDVEEELQLIDILGDKFRARADDLDWESES